MIKGKPRKALQEEFFRFILHR